MYVIVSFPVRNQKPVDFLDSYFKSLIFVAMATLWKNMVAMGEFYFHSGVTQRKLIHKKKGFMKKYVSAHYYAQYYKAE